MNAPAPLRIRHVPRATDELLLSMLRARCAGKSTAHIGMEFGVSQQEVARRTLAVRDDDIQTPDPRASPAEIRRAYW